MIFYFKLWAIFICCRTAGLIQSLQSQSLRGLSTLVTPLFACFCRTLQKQTRTPCRLIQQFNSTGQGHKHKRVCFWFSQLVFLQNYSSFKLFLQSWLLIGLYIHFSANAVQDRGLFVSWDCCLGALLLLDQLELNLMGELVQVFIHTLQAEPLGVKNTAVLTERESKSGLLSTHFHTSACFLYDISHDSCIKTSHRSNTDSFSAQAAFGAQNQKLFLVRTEGVFGHKTLFKQPTRRQAVRRKL